MKLRQIRAVGVMSALLLALVITGCGGSTSKPKTSSSNIMHVTGGWYGIPTSVTGTVAVQMTNTSTVPMNFSVQNMWEHTATEPYNSFSVEAARLKPGSLGTISVTDPSVVTVGPVAPGKTTHVSMIVTVQEPGIDDGITKVVGIQEKQPAVSFPVPVAATTSLRAVKIIPW